MRSKKRCVKFVEMEDPDTRDSQSEELDDYNEKRKALLCFHEQFKHAQIICRDAQTKIIRDFLTKSMNNQGNSNVMYISGVSGLGKTMLVTHLVQQSFKCLKGRRNSQYIYCYLNAFHFKSPQKIYLYLLQKFYKIHERTSQKALNTLNKEMLSNSSKNKKKILILDELDFLVTKDQSVIYNVVQWAHHPESKLIIIAIGNTMDLPEKMNSKVLSRIGNNRLIFRTYNSDEIIKIIEEKAKYVNLFSKEAVRFASKKLAVFSSDIRKALAVMRRSIELIMNTKQKKVQLSHIQKAFGEIFQSNVIEFLNILTQFQQLVIIMIALESKHNSKCLASALYYRINTINPIQYRQLMCTIQHFRETNIIKTKNIVVNHFSDRLIQLCINLQQIRAGITSEDLGKYMQLLDQQ